MSLPGCSIVELFAAADLEARGRVRWGTPVPLDAPGVYVVALTDDPGRRNGTLPFAPIGDRRLTELLTTCHNLRIDGDTATIDTLRLRIGSFWFPDQTALYVGLASKSVAQRVGQYYSTPLGARSPHAGGWFLKTLANLDELFVHYAACDDPNCAEQRILQFFIDAVPDKSRQRLHDPDLPLPFANLQLTQGQRKRHGITGATRCGSTRSGKRPRPPHDGEPKNGSWMDTNEPREPGPTAKVTLHEEIAAILEKNGNRWMTTSEIADEVRRRGIYKKRTGTSDVTPFQVHGRTKNYPHLFERDSIRVRLRR